MTSSVVSKRKRTPISFLTYLFSLPGGSSGRAIVLPLALAAAAVLAKSLTFKFFM